MDKKLTLAFCTTAFVAGISIGNIEINKSQAETIRKETAATISLAGKSCIESCITNHIIPKMSTQIGGVTKVKNIKMLRFIPDGDSWNWYAISDHNGLVAIEQ